MWMLPWTFVQLTFFQTFKPFQIAPMVVSFGEWPKIIKSQIQVAKMTCHHRVSELTLKALVWHFTFLLRGGWENQYHSHLYTLKVIPQPAGSLVSLVQRQGETSRVLICLITMKATFWSLVDTLRLAGSTQEVKNKSGTHFSSNTQQEGWISILPKNLKTGLEL